MIKEKSNRLRNKNKHMYDVHTKNALRFQKDIHHIVQRHLVVVIAVSQCNKSAEVLCSLQCGFYIRHRRIEKTNTSPHFPSLQNKKDLRKATHSSTKATCNRPD